MKHIVVSESVLDKVGIERSFGMLLQQDLVRAGGVGQWLAGWNGGGHGLVVVDGGGRCRRWNHAVIGQGIQGIKGVSPFHEQIGVVWMQRCCWWVGIQAAGRYRLEKATAAVIVVLLGTRIRTHPFHGIKVGFFLGIALGPDARTLDLAAPNVVGRCQFQLAAQKVFVIIGTAIAALRNAPKTVQIELPLKRGQLVDLGKVPGEDVFHKGRRSMNDKTPTVRLPGNELRFVRGVVVVVVVVVVLFHTLQQVVQFEGKRDSVVVLVVVAPLLPLVKACRCRRGGRDFVRSIVIVVMHSQDFFGRGWSDGSRASTARWLFSGWQHRTAAAAVVVVVVV
mmetsp:Transcript_15605/g.35779  ORF Transcript_15605/g.35779 Transcript_15605/m.35779 type:complete len:336 (-) Transcript_15605:43-1050(-)